MMFHEQNFKRVFPKLQNAKLLSSSTQPFYLSLCQWNSLLADSTIILVWFVVNYTDVIIPNGGWGLKTNAVCKVKLYWVLSPMLRSTKGGKKNNAENTLLTWLS